MTEDHLDALDRDALKRCMEIAKREPGRTEQLESKLKDEPWLEVAEFAAYCVQGRALHLKPWQLPPCSVNENDLGERDRDAQDLLRQLLAAGVSRYDPDPLAALKNKRRKARK